MDTRMMEKMVTDDEGVEVIQFAVSESVAVLLDAQRTKLDMVDAMKPGKIRYAEARAMGCFTAVAKGAKNRQLKSNEIFIPRPELSFTDHDLRISVFKASVPCDEEARDTRTRGATFVREGKDLGRQHRTQAVAQRRRYRSSLNRHQRLSAGDLQR